MKNPANIDDNAVKGTKSSNPKLKGSQVNQKKTSTKQLAVEEDGDSDDSDEGTAGQKTVVLKPKRAAAKKQMTTPTKKAPKGKKTTPRKLTPLQLQKQQWKEFRDNRARHAMARSAQQATVRAQTTPSPVITRASKRRLAPSTQAATKVHKKSASGGRKRKRDVDDEDGEFEG
jgi:hypothetical protein